MVHDAQKGEQIFIASKSSHLGFHCIHLFIYLICRKTINKIVGFFTTQISNLVRRSCIKRDNTNIVEKKHKKRMTSKPKIGEKVVETII